MYLLGLPLKGKQIAVGWIFTQQGQLHILQLCLAGQEVEYF